MVESNCSDDSETAARKYLVELDLTRCYEIGLKIQYNFCDLFSRPIAVFFLTIKSKSSGKSVERELKGSDSVALS